MESRRTTVAEAVAVECEQHLVESQTESGLMYCLLTALDLFLFHIVVSDELSAGVSVPAGWYSGDWTALGQSPRTPIGA